MRPTYTVYGRRIHGLNHKGEAITAGVHADGMDEEAAMAFLMRVVMQYPSVDAVVVRLDQGRDVNGQRHVIARIGQGKAWWE